MNLRTCSTPTVKATDNSVSAKTLRKNKKNHAVKLFRKRLELVYNKGSEYMLKLRRANFFKKYQCRYIVVQQFTTVSLTVLPVLRTLYKPMSMHKSTNSQNCEFCVL